jgi:putative phage-type endonuclease
MVNLATIEQQLLQDFESYNFVLLEKIDASELILHITRLALDFMFANILEMSYQNIPLEFYGNIFDLYRLQLEDISTSYLKERRLDSTPEMSNEYIVEGLNNDLYNCVVISMNIVQRYYIPCRSYKTSFIRMPQTSEKKAQLNLKIQYLKSVPQPEQRTDEWYRFRHNTLTASNLWKVFYSESSQNQLIYEKCKPLEIRESRTTNLTTPFHWGQKYEPLSVLYYEYIYGTHVDDFGCIPHPEYSYIAASPDGINCDHENERFGRMLEIKNIVNRDITGIPKMEYWVQMQIQMETCGLNECDFLETRFKEYEGGYEEFISDPNFPDPESTTGKRVDTGATTYRGIIAHFEGPTGPKYEYHSFGLTIAEILEWENTVVAKYPECTWVQTLYWHLAEISCILVLRNKPWFIKAQPHIELLWSIVEQERGGDYSHRAPKRRNTRTTDNTDNLVNNTNANLDNIDISNASIGEIINSGTRTCLIDL